MIMYQGSSYSARVPETMPSLEPLMVSMAFSRLSRIALTSAPAWSFGWPSVAALVPMASASFSDSRLARERRHSQTRPASASITAVAASAQISASSSTCAPR